MNSLKERGLHDEEYIILQDSEHYYSFYIEDFMNNKVIKLVEEIAAAFFRVSNEEILLSITKNENIDSFFKSILLVWDSKCSYWKNATSHFFTGRDSAAIFAIIKTIIEEIVENRTIDSAESFLDDLDFDDLIDFFNI